MVETLVVEPIQDATPTLELTFEQKVSFLDWEVDAASDHAEMVRCYHTVLELRKTGGALNRELERVAAKLTKKMFDLNG